MNGDQHALLPIKIKHSEIHFLILLKHACCKVKHAIRAKGHAQHEATIDHLLTATEKHLVDWQAKPKIAVQAKGARWLSQ